MTAETGKKRIGIVSLGYAWLPCEPGPSRFYYIARTFSACGWEVDLIGSSFQHFEKKPRDKKNIEAQGYPFKVTFINAPAYHKNIDIRRVWSNSVAADNVLKYLKTQRFDAVYCSIPANNIAAAVSEYCKEHGIPLIIDIEDLWPEAMQMIIHHPVLQKLFFSGFKKDAETAYKNADAVVGTSEDYTERAVKYNQRNIPLLTVYVGCDLAAFDKAAVSEMDYVEKRADEFWLTYAGSIGRSYDIKTLILAAVILQKAGREDIKIKILGSGPLKEELEALAKEKSCTNVSFLGYVEYRKMAAFLCKSDAVINSFVKGAPQSIVNKTGDYLAAGKPIINTLENPLFCKLISENQIGINIEPENPELLAAAIRRLVDQPLAAGEMGQRARKLAETGFDRNATYKKIVELTEQIRSAYDIRGEKKL